MEAREDFVESAYVDTLDWLVPVESFTDTDENEAAKTPQWKAMRSFAAWVTQSDQNLFWICGKAGSGKSTLMKKLARASRLEALLQAQFPQSQCIMAAFWFSEQSKSALLKSREGLLRSLLHQLLSRCPDMIGQVFPPGAALFHSEKDL